MDDIKEIIQTLDEENRKEFKHFLNRFRQKGSRKDVALFELLRKDEDFKSGHIMNKLYGKVNKEAYYALRKRLNKQLIDFVILKSRDNDTTAVSKVMEFINLSQYLYDRKKNALSYRYLTRALELATEIEHYELLNAIYNLLIDQNQWQSEEELSDILARHKANKKKQDLEERVNFANSIIKQKLLECQKNMNPIDFESLTSSVFSELEVDEMALQHPRTVYKLMSLSRNSIIASKDFASFEPFIRRKYRELEENNTFTAKTSYYQLGLLYYLSHTLYRNKKFTESKQYLEQLNILLNGDGIAYYAVYYPKYKLLQSSVSVFTHEIKMALENLRALLDDPRIKLEHTEKARLYVNMGIYNFLDRNISASHKNLMSIYHSDKWCEKHLGVEWVLKKNLLEVLLFFDMGKQDVAESRLRSLERTYRSLFRHPLYSRVKGFVSLIKFVVFNADQVTSKQFNEMVERSIDWRPAEEEDLQAMGFYAWLKSKMQKRDVYEVWLELAVG